MLARALDDSYPADVRRHLTGLTAARTAANACFRFAPPFLATIAAGQGVSLDRMGVALAISELSGLLSPLTARLGDHFHRRTAMVTGLAGVASGAALAAASWNLVAFAAAVVVIAQSKVLFDLGLGAWVSDHVPFERRGRVLGLTETSWALGLLLGVTSLGLVTAATSWRVGYVVGGVAVLALAAVLARRIPDDAEGHAHERRAAARPPITRRGWVIALGVLCLMAASQSLFVTFGSWLKDRFGMTDSGVSLVAFGMGFGELFSSLSAARWSDRWGKERAAATGAAIMVPAALLLALGHAHMAFGLPALVVAIASFEFAIVSAIPLGTEIVPGSPARGMALTLAMGTFGRALASIPATQLYVRHGMAWPAVLCAALAVATALTLGRAHRRRLATAPAQR